MKALLLAVSLMVIPLGGVAGDLPDPKLTPGETRPGVTVSQLCGPKRIKTRDVRLVTIPMKKEVFKRYGISWEKRSHYEVDHLIALSLGGANSIANLWPQKWSSPGAHMKDKLEVRATHDVCKGKYTLKEAQDYIAHNWLAFYKVEFEQ